MKNKIKAAVFGLLLLLVISPFQINKVQAADSIVINHNTIDNTDALIPQSYLDAARNLDILFGHQSVGGNILDGMNDLEFLLPSRYSFNNQSSEDIPTLVSWFGSNDGIGDFYAGTNGDPDSKVDEFDTKVTGGIGAVVDVAFLKFCFCLVYHASSNFRKQRAGCV
jgi:hypothetical protein